MQAADVTFFIPVKNGVPYIKECIDSIFSQSFQDWRLYILDNQSSDGTHSLCGQYLFDSRVSYILNDSDIGAIENFNQCLRLCETKYYAILSHDDLYYCTDAVEESFSLLENDPEICAVYSHLNWIDAISRKIISRKFRTVGKNYSDEIARKSIQSCRNLFGVPLLVRRTAITGKTYDARFYFTGDIDFSIATGSGSYIYTIDRECYSIRFHLKNNTMRNFSKIKIELEQIAEKHNFKFEYKDRILMMINDFRMRLEKSLFYCYLDYIRPLIISTFKG